MKVLVLLLLPALLVVVSPCDAYDHGWSSKSHSSMFVRKYDENNDNKLNVDEYPERYRKYFAKTDVNGDGYVEAAEITAALDKMKSEWRERMKSRVSEYRAKKAAQTVDRIFQGDANGDGKLNADEATSIKKSFGQVDTDKDGYLSRTEVEAALGVASKGSDASPETKNIVETAVAAGSFNTLVKAAVAAGLADALQGEGPLTVFAPTDEAFAKIPPKTIATLLKDKEALADILKYHVVAGKVLAKDVVKLTEAKTLQGNSVVIRVGDTGVQVDGANVIKTDIRCSNGVIHVIDTVIFPKTEESTSTDNQSLFRFDQDNSSDQWYTVNDNVMGGVSKGGVDMTKNNTLRFVGELSLKNNGGFASFRSKRQALDFGDGDTLVARVRGDGREYFLNLYVPSFRMAFSYRSPVQTKVDEWTEVRLPLSDFYATSFGRKVAGTLKPSQVNSVGFMLADKQAGPFELEVESIRVEKSGK